MEPGESATAAAQRELQEETGARATRVAAFMTHEHDYGDVVVVLRVCLAELDPLHEPAPLQVSACRWIPVTKLTSLDWLAANAPIIDALESWCARGCIWPPDSANDAPRVRDAT